MSNKSGVSEQIISVPEGGGALKGIGEKFSPDLFTGTGNFTVPIALPAGRNGFQPQLNLVYSTGNGNGFWGLGWGLSIPGVSRKTSHGVPRYYDYDPREKADVFILSGAEDLVPVGEPRPGVTRYRPRTEGLFARIEHHHSGTDDYWEVRSKDGLVSTYGTSGQRGTRDAAAIGKDENRKFAWRLIETRDPFGNRIVYTYGADEGIDDTHTWKQPRLESIAYAEFADGGQERFLISISFNYENRPDPFSDYRAGFEIRTTSRCTAIVVQTHADQAQPQPVRKYEFAYSNESANGVSQLTQVRVVGYGDDRLEYQELPPLTFGYSGFDPASAPHRDLIAVTGPALPAGSLARPEYELADLNGDGLPDILEMNGAIRYWRNLGNGRYDLPRFMQEAPSVQLADPGVQMVDADGDGRIDLMVTAGPLAGVYPLNLNGEWERPSIRPSAAMPTFSLIDPEVKLVDLDGDGVTDALRSGSRLEHYLFDRYDGWQRPIAIERASLESFPNVTFSDPRVKLGDMNGDGLQDIVLIHNGRVDYWPNMGRGRWGRRITMRHSPRYADPAYTLGYDPRRLLVGDVDGDGLADLVYVENNRVLLWINQSGNGWSDQPIVITGTPRVTDMDAVRLVDFLGSGINGVLWSADATGDGRPHMFFLDFTGGVKPYLLTVMDNHMGATTEVEYRPSTRFYLEDKARREPWQTTLPFPVQVVARVEVIDNLSRGKLTTEYRYHHGYWDGAEREFRGFGMVEQLDTETFDRYNADGLHGSGTLFERVDDDRAAQKTRKQFFAQPALTRTWFHLGPVGLEFGDWQADLDWSATFWPGDPPLLDAREQIDQFLRTKLSGDLPNQRRQRRDALRALRGSMLRTELYALDRYDNQDRIDPALDRPYTVTEAQVALVEIEPLAPGQAERARIFFPHGIAQCTTQWERGHDPLTQFAFTDYLDENGDFDAYGRPLRQTQIACPRGWPSLADPPGDAYLATHTATDYITRDDDRFMVDRVARVTAFEILDTAGKTLAEVGALVADPANLACIGQTVNHYDQTLNHYDDDTYGQIDDFGALTQTEALAFTLKHLNDAFDGAIPPYLEPVLGAVAWTGDYPIGFQGLKPLAGHVFHELTAKPNYQTGYFVRTRREYDFQHNPTKARGLVKVQFDPLGNQITVDYDDFDLLPIAVTDARDLQTLAEHNYRVLQPGMITDPNGNRIVVTYSPLGLPLSLAVVGKKDARQGDRRREANPATGTLHVDYPSVVFEYGLRAYFDTEHLPPDERDPVYVRTLKRQEHFWDTVAAENTRRAAAGQSVLTETEIDALFPAGEQQTHSERFIEVREYSDGFGRLLQTRTQGEAERFGDDLFGNGVLPADQADRTGTTADVAGKRNTNPLSPNVVVSGWQTYDNKGRVVEKYEPYFDQDWDYDARGTPQGVKATMFYDPRGQVVRTLNPDGSEQRVVYGVPGSVAHPNLSQVDATGQIVYEPTPWEAYTYDANDLAPLSYAPDGTSLAARAPASHHFTPSSIEIDALGRTVKAVQRLSQTEEIVTRSEYDLLGNLVKIVDALGREAFLHVFDLAKRRLWLKSIDAGERWTVYDAAGNVIEARDGKGSLTLRAYDELNRPTHVWARNLAGENVTLRERLIYGDDPPTGLPPADTIAPGDAESGNLVGRLYRYYDEAGMLTFAIADANRLLTAYDFKGNLLEKVRRVIAGSAITGVQPFRVNWDAGMALDAAEYRTSTAYDALNRTRTITYPLDEDGERKVLIPRYNRAGALESVEMESARLRRQTYVERIAYNARGQRTLIAYGNQVVTRYTYDTHTFRLARLRTERCATPDALTFQPNTATTNLQDLAYEYDLAGNITRITGRARGSGVRNNPEALLFPDLAAELAAGDALVRRFAYDPLYRLVEATGRQAAQQTAPCTDYDPRREGFNWSGNAPATSPENARDVTQFYTESYAYDPAGNLLSQRRTGSGTRYFGMSGFTPEQWQDKVDAFLAGQQPAWGDKGNHLTNYGDDTTGQTHDYDANGNLIQENTERSFAWDHADRLVSFTNQATQSCPASVEAIYLYDAAGNRVKKLVRNQQQQTEVTVYIDGLFEHHIRTTAAGTEENNTLHVMDNQSRVAVVRVGDPLTGDNTPTVKYHLGDHLGSSNVVVGGDNASVSSFINQEEYYPYGETSFGSFALKRYRYSGKERDEESGLHYFGLRYYAAWLARWASCDPVGALNGANLYIYVQANPMRLVDKYGADDSSAPLSMIDAGRVCGVEKTPAPLPFEGETGWGDDPGESKPKEPPEPKTPGDENSGDKVSPAKSDPTYKPPYNRMDEVLKESEMASTRHNRIQLVKDMGADTLTYLAVGLAIGAIGLAATFVKLPAPDMPLLPDDESDEASYEVSVTPTADLRHLTHDEIKSLAQEYHDRLISKDKPDDTQAWNHRTTAILRGRTASGEDVWLLASSSKRKPSPAQRSLLDEIFNVVAVPGRSPHAEVAGIDYAYSKGITILDIYPSRHACIMCTEYGKFIGARIHNP